MRIINSAGIALIKAYETLRLTAYQDQAGVWTCGWGHTGGVTAATTCTPELADAWLESDLTVAESAVGKLVTRILSDNQFAALVSLVFNIGEGNFAKSNLLIRLNDNAPDALVLSHLKSFVFSGGKLSQGLVKRRAAEAALWSIPELTS